MTSGGPPPPPSKKTLASRSSSANDPPPTNRCLSVGPLAGHRLRGHGRDLASLGEPRRHRGVARRRQRSRRGGAAAWPQRDRNGGLGLAPEVLEPIGRQLGIAHRVLDVLMPQISLQSACIVAGIGQRIAAGVALLWRRTIIFLPQKIEGQKAAFLLRTATA